MRIVARSASRLMRSVLVGLSAVFLVSAVLVGLAFATDRVVFLPWVLRVWVTSENGLPAVNVVPNGSGILLGVALVALVSAVWGARVDCA